MNYCPHRPSASPHLWKLEVSQNTSIHGTKMTHYLLLCIPWRQSPLSSYKYTKQENNKERILASNCRVGWQFLNKTLPVGGCQLRKIESHLQEYHNFEEILCEKHETEKPLKLGMREVPIPNQQVSCSFRWVGPSIPEAAQLLQWLFLA